MTAYQPALRAAFVLVDDCEAPERFCAVLAAGFCAGFLGERVKLELRRR